MALFKTCGLAAALIVVASAAPASDSAPSASKTCRVVPGDALWPSDDDWKALNTSTGGRLIRGKPLAQPCYDLGKGSPQCQAIQKNWVMLDPYLADPVNVMQPDFQNNSCSPFLAPQTPGTGNGSCTLGNLAQYAIDVNNAQSAIAGLRFAVQKNLRLTIKSTGHDYLGRSTGKGSLALWTHNLKGATFYQYSSANYTGPAARIPVGMEGQEITQAAGAKGLVVVGGSCPTVGTVGGWLQAGGHGPLTSAYGLGADNALEYEVITADGQHFNATPSNQHSDLYWALSGGGAGNYAFVLSTTVKAYADKPVAGATFTFANSDADNFWAGVRAWYAHLLTLSSSTPGLKTIGSLTNASFALNFATWPGATTQQMAAALAPYYATLARLNITLASNKTTTHASYKAHFDAFTTAPYTVNETVASRLIPKTLVQDSSRLDALVSRMRTAAQTGAIFNIIASNVSHSAAAAPNAVLPAWRPSLAHMNFGYSLDADAPDAQISARHDAATQLQSAFRDLSPGSGSYINEASYSDATWKEDYYGPNYQRLLGVKKRYDPNGTFWAAVAVGSDADWVLGADGRLCRP